MRRFYALLLPFLLTFGTANATDDGTWWGYYNENSSTTNFGTRTQETYNTAMFVPADYATGSDGTVDGFRFYVWTPYNLSNVKVWISRSLPENDTTDCLEVVELNKDSLKSYKKGSMNEVRFSQPYAINDGLYVGYTFTVDTIWYDGDDDNNYPLVITGDEGDGNGMWFRTSKTQLEWKQTNNELAAQVLLGGTVRNNAVRVNGFSSCNSVVNSQGEAQFQIINLCKNGLSNFDYEIDGTRTYNGHYDFSDSLTVFGAKSTVTLYVPGDNTTGLHNQTIHITKVNGADNELPAQYTSAQGQVLTVAKNSPRHTVMEEFTGTWCGYCPRGIGGMNAVEQQYGDTVVLMAFHRGLTSSPDPMQVSAADAWTDSIFSVSGFPAGLLNRSILCDPYWGQYQGVPFGIKYDINEEQRAVTEASVDLSAQWGDTEQTVIVANAKTTFQYSDNEAPYSLAYVLIADSLTGTTKSWWQRNYLHGSTYYADDEYLKEFVDKPSVIKDMVFRHVVIDAQGIVYGLDGSITAPLVENQQQDHKTTFDLSNNALVQDKNKLKVAVMLINTRTGKVVNAAQTSVIGTADGINSVASKASSQIVAIYSVDGKRLTSLQKGLNIVKMSDGTTQKILK